MNKFRASFVTSLTIALAALVVALSGCSRGTVNAKVNEVKVVEAPDPNLVAMDHPELFPTVAVELRKIPNELPVNGVIAPDVSRTVPVNALSGGRVVEIKVQLGDYVEKGQVLLTLTSPDLSSAISDYRKAVADEALSKRQLERSQLLFENGALAQKDLQIAEDTEEKARVDLQTTAEHIRILGGRLRISRPSSKFARPSPEP